MPFFSIIIPCYNQAHFLSDCLDSLLVQEFQDWEAIVVNDGSTDATNAVALSYTKTDSRIKLVTQPNGGLSAARNQGIRSASGERFIFLDADDFLYNDCLISIHEFAKKASHFDLIHYGYTHINDDKSRILAKVSPQKRNQFIPDIFRGNLGPPNSICIAKKLVEKIGFFDIYLKSVEDWDFWIRAAKAGAKLKIIQKQLVYYRYSQNSMSRNPFVMYAALKTVIKRAPQHDNRILGDSKLNKDYEFAIQPVLQEVLLRSVGVGIMQGKVQETLDFFLKETTQPLFSHKPQDFELMCSYMSFRYWYSKSDIEAVFTKIHPQFVAFFKIAGFSDTFTKQALYVIFKRHLYYKNRYRYGKNLGTILNFMMRTYNEKIVSKLQ